MSIVPDLLHSEVANVALGDVCRELTSLEGYL